MGDAGLVESYRRDGFVVIRGLLTGAEIAALNAECAAVAGGDNVLALHFPHKLSDAFRAAMRHPALVVALTRLIGPDVKAIQSMLFVKPGGKPGQAWHQDEYFLPTRDRSLCAAWIALDDADVENGCLWVHAGSHSSGVIFPVAAHGDVRFDASPEASFAGFQREGGTAVEMIAGDVLFFHGYLLHRSLPNLSRSRTRRSLVVHYMNARSMLPWNHDGASPTDDYRDIELVAGADPYSWKGIADIARPFVRSESAA